MCNRTPRSTCECQESIVSFKIQECLLQIPPTPLPLSQCPPPGLQVLAEHTTSGARVRPGCPCWFTPPSPSQIRSFCWQHILSAFAACLLLPQDLFSTLCHSVLSRSLPYICSHVLCLPAGFQWGALTGDGRKGGKEGQHIFLWPPPCKAASRGGCVTPCKSQGNISTRVSLITTELE